MKKSPNNVFSRQKKLSLICFFADIRIIWKIYIFLQKLKIQQKILFEKSNKYQLKLFYAYNLNLYLEKKEMLPKSFRKQQNN